MVMRRLREYIPWVLLLVYWPALFVLTHLPKLPATTIRGGDKVAHFSAYLMLTLLFWIARYGTYRPSLRDKRILYVLIILLCYGAVDELSQQLVPNRFADMLDWLADAGGVLTGLLIILALRQWWRRLTAYWVAMFALTHWPTETQPLDFLPELLQEFRLVYLMTGYAVLTLLWWRTWCPADRLVFNKTIFASIFLILPMYVLTDIMITWAMHRPLSSVSDLWVPACGIFLGTACSAALSQ